MNEVGFIITPSEIADRVNGIERAIRNLDAQISASREPRVDERFREAFRDLTVRWQMVRDSFESWGSRLSASRAIPVLDDWTQAVRRWHADFQRRITGPAAPAAPSARAQAEALTTKAPGGPRFVSLLFAAALGFAGAFLLLRPREEST
jgi:hypothetical protein